MSQTPGRSDPPEHSRFKKGQSGNPNGRPRKVKAAPASGSPFDIVFDRTLTIRAGGEAREVDVEEALLHKTLQDALAGNRPARRKILKMIARREAERAKRRARTKAPGGRIPWKIENASPLEPNAAMLTLGIVRKDPAWEDPPSYMKPEGADRFLLEPWAVQAALGRRRGGSVLEPKQISDINRCTWRSERIRWPREGEQ
jgi:hypothetical protein